MIFKIIFQPYLKEAAALRKGGNRERSLPQRTTKGPEQAEPLSPYIIFCSRNREKVKAANPEATFGELGKLLGHMWSNLDAQGRNVSPHAPISIVIGSINVGLH